MTDLFAPLTVGSVELPNRVIMAPLTRVRSGRDGVPNALNVEHYAQRSSVGLIVTEGTYPSVVGQAFPYQPGIATTEHVEGWRRVADAVHGAGGRLFMQVMHGGRISHPGFNGGQRPVAPSAVAAPQSTYTYEGKEPLPVPRALAAEELPGVVEDFVQGARNAVEAGMDGVEIHGANGYLLHQFLAPGANLRTDEYGGTPANRARLVVEVVRAVAAAVGPDRVGLRISPEHNIQGTVEEDHDDVVATYGALLDGVADLGLAYLSVLHDELEGDFVQGLRRRFGGVVLVNRGRRWGEMHHAEAQRLVDGGLADAVVIGRAVIANPDLVRRWQEGLPVAPADPSTFYTQGAEGYTDYPFARV
ncbi:alkene reductase [Kocuria sp. M1R5S2]|uniref:alkene reductase n=1 Tax=Kocuria rhizosphaerae TaxID=3376285 RepID=UPI0037AB1D04